MKTIKSLKSKRVYDPHTVYTYIVDDSGNDMEVTSLQEFEPGEKVRCWFDPIYNMPKIGKLCQKCLKPIKHPAEHEFCELKHF